MISNFSKQSTPQLNNISMVITKKFVRGVYHFQLDATLRNNN